MVSHPLPRKGTETELALKPFDVKMQQLRFTPITPQGDGNLETPLRFDFSNSSFTPITPQGDGNVFSSGTKCSAWLMKLAVSHPLPRKGTETPDAVEKTVDALSWVSHPLPRKGTETLRRDGRGKVEE